MHLKDFTNLSEDTQIKMNQVFDWFNSNVSRLESAYKDIGLKFDQISQELEEKNRQLIQSFVDNEAIKTQLRSVLESINSGVIMINTNERITLFNPAAEKIYALKADDALGKPYSQVMNRKDKAAPLHLIETLENKKEFADQEKYWDIKGKVKPIGFTTSVVRDHRGKVLGAVEISTDLTQMKQMQNQIQHAKTLAALGQMAATVAHEIRNPLGAIGGFAGLLVRDLDAQDSRRDLVNKIVQGVSSLNKIVSNLLVFSRPMELQLQHIDFIEWIEEILRYSELEVSSSEKKIIFQRQFSSKSIPVHIDPEKFQQVLLNLTFNGIQAIRQEGIIKIAVELNADSFLIISIRDNGKGIPSENMDKIFDPFFTSREQGTGLGLAIVKRIVELHGGTITVKSEVNRWTEFTITLNSKGNVING
ncbi:nitrogen regulation protein NR(II) [Fibrobacterota bacterium]